MYLRLFTLVCCLCFGGITAVSAQDQINLLNGQQLAVKVLEVQDSLVHYEYVKRKDKVREEYMRDFRIFSLVQEGKETVFYEQDSAKGNPLAIDEMRNFIIVPSPATTAGSACRVRVEPRGSPADAQ